MSNTDHTIVNADGSLNKFAWVPYFHTTQPGCFGWMQRASANLYFATLDEALAELAKPYGKGVIEANVQWFDIEPSETATCNDKKTGWRWVQGGKGRPLVATRKRKQEVRLTKLGRNMKAFYDAKKAAVSEI